MRNAVKSEIAPNGILRAAINTGNELLVTGSTPAGDPVGVSPDMAKAIADELGVVIKYVPYAKPSKLAEAADDDVWDIGLVGAEPQRAERISFTAAYAEIEATYLVAKDSPLKTISDVDRPGMRIVVKTGSAYDLWLRRNIKQASLIHAETLNEAYELFAHDKLDALAGLRSRLLLDVEKMPGVRLLAGKFTSVQQAIGTQKRNKHAAEFLSRFVEDAKRSGLVASFIERHGVKGLSVAPIVSPT